MPGSVPGSSCAALPTSAPLRIAFRHLLPNALAPALVAITFGTLVGAISGYFGGTIDNLLMRFVDFALAFPRIFMLILFAIIFMRPPFSDNPIIVFIFSPLYTMPIVRIGTTRWLMVT